MRDSSPRLLVAFTAATALVVGLVAALATDNWIFLPAALVVHAIGTFLVMRAIAPRIADDPEPDPLVKERLEEEQATVDGG
jgi:p-aminobenzoyl-glutamate transporter AbgT